VYAEVIEYSLRFLLHAGSGFLPVVKHRTSMVQRIIIQSVMYSMLLVYYFVLRQICTLEIAVFCLTWHNHEADMAELLTPLLNRIRIPFNYDKVYKDECAFCFDSPVRKVFSVVCWWSILVLIRKLKLKKQKNSNWELLSVEVVCICKIRLIQGPVKFSDLYPG